MDLPFAMCFDTAPSRRLIASLIAFGVLISVLGALVGHRANERRHEAWLRFKHERHCEAMAQRVGGSGGSIGVAASRAALQCKGRHWADGSGPD